MLTGVFSTLLIPETKGWVAVLLSHYFGLPIFYRSKTLEELSNEDQTNFVKVPTRHGQQVSTIDI